MNLVYKHLINDSILDINFLNKTWGIDTVEKANMVKQSFVSFSETYNDRDIKMKLNTTSGLIVTRSVSQWLFNNCDDLWHTFFPSRGCQYFILNQTSASTVPSKVYTGNDTIAYLYSYITLNGNNETIFGTKLEGSSEMQFLPFLRPNPIFFFDLTYQKGTKLIKTDVQPNFTQFIYEETTWDSSVTGLSSIRPAFGNIPFYLSNPFLHGVEDQFKKKITGIISPVNNSISQPLWSILNINSATGIPVEANICSQFNLFLTTNELNVIFDVPEFMHMNIKTERIWPLFYQRSHTTSSASQDKTIQDIQKQEQQNKEIFTYGGYGIGAVIFIVGLVLFVIGVPRINNDGYTMIN